MHDFPVSHEMLLLYVCVYQDTSYTRVAESCVIHTSMGDIHLKLFAKEWVPTQLVQMIKQL